MNPWPSSTKISVNRFHLDSFEADVLRMTLVPFPLLFSTYPSCTSSMMALRTVILLTGILLPTEALTEYSCRADRRRAKCARVKYFLLVHTKDVCSVTVSRLRPAFPYLLCFPLSLDVDPRLFHRPHHFCSAAIGVSPSIVCASMLEAAANLTVCSGGKPRNSPCMMPHV